MRSCSAVSGGVFPKDGSKLPPSLNGGGVALPFSCGEGVNTTAGSGIAGDMVNVDGVEGGAGSGAGAGVSVELAPMKCSTRVLPWRQQQSGNSFYCSYCNQS